MHLMNSKMTRALVLTAVLGRIETVGGSNLMDLVATGLEVFGRKQVSCFESAENVQACTSSKDGDLLKDGGVGVGIGGNEGNWLGDVV
jgi:hypothetical protein